MMWHTHLASAQLDTCRRNQMLHVHLVITTVIYRKAIDICTFRQNICTKKNMVILNTCTCESTQRLQKNVPITCKCTALHVCLFILKTSFKV